MNLQNKLQAIPVNTVTINVQISIIDLPLIQKKMSKFDDYEASSQVMSALFIWFLNKFMDVWCFPVLLSLAESLRMNKINNKISATWTTSYGLYTAE